MRQGRPDAEQLRRLAGSLRKAGGTTLSNGLSLAARSRVGRAALAAIREVAESKPQPRTIFVWDLPTRIFKWSLVLCVGTAFLISSMHPHGLLFTVHIACGYAITLLLLFRLAWGAIGGERARFTDFVQGWRGIRAHAIGLLRLDPEETAGHNAIGGWMILLLLATLAATVITGLLSEGSTGGAGRLSNALPTKAIPAVAWLHGTLGFAIIWLAGAHVAGVVVESLLHRENLVRAMITGRKRVRSPTLADARAVSLWRAVPIVLALALLGAWLIAGTHLPPPA
jgi:cytochrome b